MVTANFRTNRLRPKIAIVLLFIITTAMFLTGSAATTEIKDIDIILAVDRQLQDDQEVPAYLIGVRTRDGIVTLGGLVNNLLACERAADVAATIKGVRSVVNRIDVLPVLRTDDQIRKDVELALFDDPATDLFDIQVHARNGTVILSGMADSWQEQKLCVQVAKGVIGIKAVKSNIKVSQRSKRPDVEIGVTVNNQLVILNGRVDSGLEKAKAGDVASAVKGVVSVTNNL